MKPEAERGEKDRRGMLTPSFFRLLAGFAALLAVGLSVASTVGYFYEKERAVGASAEARE